MDIRKLKHSSDQIQAVFDMATDGTPTAFTEKLGLSQWPETERCGVEILGHISEDNQKIDVAFSGVNQALLKTDDEIVRLSDTVEDLAEQVKQGTNATQSSGLYADMAVNQLRTDNWIQRYLQKDMSQADYICIKGDSIEFRDAQTDGTVIQAKNDDGTLLYWANDVDKATISNDGWPYLDGERIFVTTEVTDWPVYHYEYTENVKRSTHFEMVNDLPGVIDTFGVGDGDGGNRGWIVKSIDGMQVLFRTSNKQDIGVTMNNSGYMDLYGMRRTSLLDLSEVPFGKLYELVDGIDTEFSWTIERDASNRPIKVIDDIDGHVCQVRWWD